MQPRKEGTNLKKRLKDIKTQETSTSKEAKFNHLQLPRTGNTHQNYRTPSIDQEGER